MIRHASFSRMWVPLVVVTLVFSTVLPTGCTKNASTTEVPDVELLTSEGNQLYEAYQALADLPASADEDAISAVMDDYEQAASAAVDRSKSDQEYRARLELDLVDLANTQREKMPAVFERLSEGSRTSLGSALGTHTLRLGSAVPGTFDDLDRDHVLDFIDADADGDGVSHLSEDDDSDGIPDAQDADDDNDGIPDDVEHLPGRGSSEGAVQATQGMKALTPAITWAKVSEVLGSVASTSAVLSANSAEQTDADSDGLPDALEGRTREITVTVDARTTTVEVTSDPAKSDSDSDGVSDFYEYVDGTDPGNSDTDGDGLSDQEELDVWLTDPNNTDTDNDNTAAYLHELWDGAEVNTLGTNPRLADTDGDTVSDGDEHYSQKSDPLVANVPQLYVAFKGINPRLVYTESYQRKTKKQFETTNLKTNESKSTFHDTKTTKTTFDEAWNIKSGLKAAFPGGFSASAEGGISVDQVFSTSSEQKWEQDTLQQDSVSAKEMQEMVEESSVSFDHGEIRTTVSVTNKGTGSAVLNSIDIIIYTTRSSDPGSLANIGEHTLKFDKPYTLTAGSTVEKSIDITPITVGDISSLLNGSRTLLIEAAAGGIDATFPNGKSLAEQFTVIRDCCSQITVDQGNGHVLQRLVASNGRRDSNSKLPVPISVVDVLKDSRVFGYGDLVVEPSGAGNGRVIRTMAKLSAIKGTDASPKSAMWMILGQTPRNEDPLDVADIENVRLRGHAQVQLLYGIDSDGDGLLDPQESWLGSRPDLVDTDYDGVDDFSEVTGWDVSVVDKTGHRVASVTKTSDPLAFDTDRDGLEDSAEKSSGSDPTVRDTDGGGVPDVDESKNKGNLTNGTDDAKEDTDKGGTCDLQEADNGTDRYDKKDDGVITAKVDSGMTLKITNLSTKKVTIDKVEYKCQHKDAFGTKVEPWGWKNAEKLWGTKFTEKPFKGATIKAGKSSSWAWHWDYEEYPWTNRTFAELKACRDNLKVKWSVEEGGSGTFTP